MYLFPTALVYPVPQETEDVPTVQEHLFVFLTASVCVRVPVVHLSLLLSRSTSVPRLQFPPRARQAGAGVSV